MIEALASFLVDKVPEGCPASYEIHDRSCHLSHMGEVVESRRGDRYRPMTVHVPMVDLPEWLLTARAVEMLMLAAHRNSVKREAVPQWFRDHDIPLHKYWDVGGTQLALTTAEYLGRRPVCGDKSGLLLFNPPGVVRIDGR